MLLREGACATYSEVAKGSSQLFSSALHKAQKQITIALLKRLEITYCQILGLRVSALTTDAGKEERAVEYLL